MLIELYCSSSSSSPHPPADPEDLFHLNSVFSTVAVETFVADALRINFLVIVTLLQDTKMSAASFSSTPSLWVDPPPPGEEEELPLQLERFARTELKRHSERLIENVHQVEDPFGGPAEDVPLREDVNSHIFPLICCRERRQRSLRYGG